MPGIDDAERRRLYETSKRGQDPGPIRYVPDRSLVNEMKRERCPGCGRWADGVGATRCQCVTIRDPNTPTLAEKMGLA